MRRALAICFVVFGTVSGVSGQSANTGPTHVLVSHDYYGAKTAVLKITKT